MVASTLYYWLPPDVDVLHGVRKLPAGTWEEYHRDGTVSSGTYWDIADEAARAAAGPPPDLARVLEDSVRAHLVADVPVASFLSGGLDSSLVTAMAQRQQTGSRPTPSPSGRRTSGSRRCLTTRGTPGSWLGTSVSACTRSRSARTW